MPGTAVATSGSGMACTGGRTSRTDCCCAVARWPTRSPAVSCVDAVRHCCGAMIRFRRTRSRKSGSRPTERPVRGACTGTGCCPGTRSPRSTACGSRHRCGPVGTWRWTSSSRTRWSRSSDCARWSRSYRRSCGPRSSIRAGEEHGASRRSWTPAIPGRSRPCRPGHDCYWQTRVAGTFATGTGSCWARARSSCRWRTPPPGASCSPPPPRHVGTGLPRVTSPCSRPQAGR